jgi:metalloendopeptidase OMA1, mitochondrial
MKQTSQFEHHLNKMSPLSLLCQFIRNMMRTLSKAAIYLVAILLIASCRETPVTERKQLILIPESSEMKLGEDAFSKIIKESKLSKNRILIEKVRKIGKHIAKTADRPDYKWEFVVIEDDSTANAFCLPGGKIGLYTGILPYTKMKRD